MSLCTRAGGERLLNAHRNGPLDQSVGVQIRARGRQLTTAGHLPSETARELRPVANSNGFLPSEAEARGSLAERLPGLGGRSRRAQRNGLARAELAVRSAR